MDCDPYLTRTDAMKPHKETHTDTATDFLASLGIEPREDVNTPGYWDACRAMIRQAGGDPEIALPGSDPMAREVGNLYFLTPEIAAHFLAADFPRLTEVFAFLSGMPLISPSTSRVAEVGGGPGLVSLWLATRHPQTQFTVFDYAENTLDVGRIWAKRLGVGNIHHELASYDELGSGVPLDGSFDLVLGLGALDLSMRAPLHKKVLSLSEHTLDLKARKTKTLHAFCKACATLLKPGGLLYFSQGSITDLGLLSLFDAFRAHNLGINWEHTKVVGEGNGPAFTLKAFHILAQPGLSGIFSSAKEDLQTFLYSAKHKEFSHKLVLGHADFESWLGLLKEGTRLADIQVQRHDGTAERHAVFVKNGILGFFSSTSGGVRSGYIHSAASFAPCCRRLAGIVGAYQKKNVTITEAYWHPIFT